MPRPILMLLVLILPLAACAEGGPRVELKGRSFQVEIADDDGERQMGMMFRDHLPPDHGMLFIFEDEAERAFWMMNTRIPLDILYFDADYQLVSVSRDTPPCRSKRRCPSYPSEGPARYVLELNAGLADELGVRKGDRLSVHL